MTMPNGLTEIKHFYGAFTFDASGNVVSPANWYENNIAKLLLPKPIMSYDGKLAAYVYIHIDLRGSLLKVLTQLLDDYPDSYNKLFFSGSYNPRLKRDIGEPSVHAFGAAIDFNDYEFPLTRGTVYTEEEMPEWYQSVVHCFHLEGWKWGGDFGDRMHFQYATGY